MIVVLELTTETKKTAYFRFSFTMHQKAPFVRQFKTKIIYTGGFRVAFCWAETHDQAVTRGKQKMITRVVAHEWTAALQSSVVLEIIPNVHHAAAFGGDRSNGGGYARRSDELLLSLDGQDPSTTPVVVDVYEAAALPSNPIAAVASRRVRGATTTGAESIIYVDDDYPTAAAGDFGDASNNVSHNSSHAALEQQWRYVRTLSFVQRLAPNDRLVVAVGTPRAGDGAAKTAKPQRCSVEGAVAVRPATRFLRLDMRGVLWDAAAASSKIVGADIAAPSPIPATKRADESILASFTPSGRMVMGNTNATPQRCLSVEFSPPRRGGGDGADTPNTLTKSRRIIAESFDKHIVAVSISEAHSAAPPQATVFGRMPAPHQRAAPQPTPLAARGAQPPVAAGNVATPIVDSQRPRVTLHKSSGSPASQLLRRRTMVSGPPPVPSPITDTHPMASAYPEGLQPTPARVSGADSAGTVWHASPAVCSSTPARDEAARILFLRSLVADRRQQFGALLQVAAAKEEALAAEVAQLRADTAAAHEAHLMERERYHENQRRLLKALKAAGY